MKVVNAIIEILKFRKNYIDYIEKIEIFLFLFLYIYFSGRILGEIYLLKVNSDNINTTCEICSKLTIRN